MTNPSTLIFLGLAVVWAIVLLPEGIKRFTRMRRADSIRSFNHQLLALDRGGADPRGPRTGRTHGTADSNVIDLRSRNGLGGVRTAGSDRGRRPAVSGGGQVHKRVPSPAVRRRRQEVTATLAAAVILTLLCLLAFGTAFLVPQLIADVLLGTYLYLVAQANRTTPMHSSIQMSPADRHRAFGVGVHGAGDHLGSTGIRIRPVPAASGQVAASR